MTRSLLGASLMVGLAAAPVRAEDLKLGFVDMQRAVEETEDGRKAKAELKRVFDTKQKEINEQQDNLRKRVEELDKKRTLLPADKVKDQETQLSQEMQKLQQTFMRHQEDLQKRQQEVMGQIVDRMQRIIGRISSSENFSMIFDRTNAGLVFAKPHLDLTNELIRRYNAGEGRDGGGGAPAKKAAPAAAPKK